MLLICQNSVDTIEVILGEWRDTEYKYVGTQELLMKLKVKTQLPLQHQVAKLVTNPHLIEKKSFRRNMRTSDLP